MMAGVANSSDVKKGKYNSEVAMSQRNVNTNDDNDKKDVIEEEEVPTSMGF